LTGAYRRTIHAARNIYEYEYIINI